MENSPMYRRILLPLDGSLLAEEALPYAVAQASCCAAELVLLKVLQPLPERTMSLSSRRQAEELSTRLAHEYLERVASSIEPRTFPLDLVTVEGQADTQIVRYAEENDVDLIVMSSRGQSGLSRWLMGSVADRVVRGATVPVLLIRTVETGAG
jgi:nucleotide-binding universal stress UspA family protein